MGHIFLGTKIITVLKPLKKNKWQHRYRESYHGPCTILKVFKNNLLQ